jgi:putative heme iron utilization protein
MPPTPAERARTQLSLHRRATLATLDADYRPDVAPVPFLADGAGNPVMVLSRLDPHTSRAFQDQRAGLVVGDHVSLQGDLVAVPGIVQLDLQDRYLEVHPEAASYVESLAHAWFTLVVSHVRLRDHGTEAWLEVDDFANAAPDPITPAGPWLMAELSDLLSDDLLGLTRTVGGRLHARSAELVGIDRYGMAVIVDDEADPDGDGRARIEFPDRLDQPEQVHPTVAFMVRTARSRLG